MGKIQKNTKQLAEPSFDTGKLLMAQIVTESGSLFKSIGQSGRPKDEKHAELIQFGIFWGKPNLVSLNNVVKTC